VRSLAVNQYAAAGLLRKVSSAAVVAFEALAVTIGIVGGIFGHGTGVVALAAGSRVQEAIIVTVYAAGTVLRIMGGKLPLGHDIHTGDG
jgi:hypothetical protein